MDDRSQYEVDSMEETAKTGSDHHGPLRTELHEKAKDDPELAEHMQAANRVIDGYREALQQLADS